MDDDIGFTFFLNISYKQHIKDFPNDDITFHDFSSICMTNWESLEEESKNKIIELAKKENEEINKKEHKISPNIDTPISLDSDSETNESIVDLLDIKKIIEIAESIKKHFGKHYGYCKKPRSAYIYFVKAARIEIKNRIPCSKDNFIKISKAISYKWNEIKLSQRSVFEDLATLDKRFNEFRVHQAAKKKPNSGHTPLFLKAKAEAQETHASVSNSSPESLQNLRNMLAARASRRNSKKRLNSSTIKRKNRRRKRKIKKRSTAASTRRLTATLPSFKSERSTVETKKKLKIKKREL